MAKTNRTLLYGGLAALVVVAYIATEPSGPPPKKPTTKRAGRSSLSKKGMEQFTQADLDAKFGRLNDPVENAFRPLVVKGGSTSGLPVNQIPASYAGGSGTWFYTGTVVIDSVPMALLEESSSGSGGYYKVGDPFKVSTVLEITPNSLVLAGPDGGTKKFYLIEDKPIVEDGNFASSAPVNPLSGPIGLTPREGSGRNAQNLGQGAQGGGQRGGANANSNPDQFGNRNNEQNQPD